MVLASQLMPTNRSLAPKGPVHIPYSKSCSRLGSVHFLRLAPFCVARAWQGGASMHRGPLWALGWVGLNNIVVPCVDSWQRAKSRRVLALEVLLEAVFALMLVTLRRRCKAWDNNGWWALRRNPETFTKAKNIKLGAETRSSP